MLAAVMTKAGLTLFLPIYSCCSRRSLVPPGMDIFLVKDKLKGAGDMTAAAAQQLSAATAGQTPEQVG